MFNSKKLRQVISVDRHGSFSRAAEALNITQSTVTKAVSDVERDLGYALFDRKARGTVATEMGREFLNRAARIVADMELLIQDARIQKNAEESTLRIGVIPPSIEGLLNRSLQKLMKENKELCVSLSAFPAERGIRMLGRGDVDLLVAPKEAFGKDPDFEVIDLGDLHANVFCRLGHPLAGLKKINRNDITDYKIISPEIVGQYADAIVELYEGSGNDPLRSIHVIENFPIVADLVANSDLLGAVSDRYSTAKSFQKRFHVLDLDVFQPMPLACVYRSKWLPGRNMRAFISALKQYPPGDYSDR